MKKIYLLALGVLLLAGADAWAGTFTANVSAVPAGGGKVYVTNSSAASLDDCTQSTSTWSNKSNNGLVEYTVYAFAKADDDYRFLGWKETNSADASVVSTQAEGYELYYKMPSSGNATINRYAFFERIAARFSDAQTEEDINALLTETDGMVMEELTVTRPVYRNTYYNTLCLPFSMDAAQIAASPLAGAEIKAFTGASVDGGVLNINLTRVYETEAGKPYFIKYSNADVLNQLDFENVTVDAAAPQAVTFNGVTLQGTYVPFAMAAQAEVDYNGGYLFLGQNNQLYWPGESGSIKPFRAYFFVNAGTSDMPVRRGMPASFSETDSATGVDDVQGGDMQTKIIENGRMYILRGGVRYNAHGQVVK